ncbi:MAG: 30S ribosomal protein S6 [Phycisphaerales bacterium]|nr:MAG: 30S ribosomal protein S6 [Phycisphaerales bacterium]
MSKDQKKYYEAMFLISQAVAADFADAIAHIREILSRAGAEVVAMKKWDDRRLAYEIDKQKRGVYILVYAALPGDGVEKIHHDCNLSEKIMRVMVIKADHLTLEEMQANDDAASLTMEANLRSGPRERDEQAMAGAAAPAADADAETVEDIDDED